MELPYMKLWTQRFFGSVRVQALRGEHRLIYLGLLVAEWGLDGRGLPNDNAELARILGVSEDAMRDAWGDGESRVSQFFKLKNGRLFNETLEDTLLEDKRERRALIDRAKKGARKRWDKKSTHAWALLKQCPAEDGDGEHQDGDEGANGELVKLPGESFRQFDRRCELAAEERKEAARRKREAEDRAERQAPVADPVPAEEVHKLLKQLGGNFGDPS